LKKLNNFWRVLCRIEILIKIIKGSIRRKE